MMDKLMCAECFVYESSKVWEQIQKLLRVLYYSIICTIIIFKFEFEYKCFVYVYKS